MDNLDHLTPDQRRRYDALMADLADRKLRECHELVAAMGWTIHPGGWVSPPRSHLYTKLHARLDAMMKSEKVVQHEEP
jgi:hypothetical protein